LPLLKKRQRDREKNWPGKERTGSDGGGSSPGNVALPKFVISEERKREDRNGKKVQALSRWEENAASDKGYPERRETLPYWGGRENMGGKSSNRKKKESAPPDFGKEKVTCLRERPEAKSKAQ